MRDDARDVASRVGSELITSGAQPYLRGEATRTWVPRVIVIVVAATFLVVLASVLWQTPYPLSEGVALLEDVDGRGALGFLSPSTTYYRPLFHLTLYSAWHAARSPATFVMVSKWLHIIPLTILVVLMLRSIQMKTATEAAAGLFAIAVLLGSSGLLDNLEIPLTYTIVGMPAALAVWMIAERPYASWHGAAIAGLMLVAVGFKEQGLVIVPLVIALWWTGAPGVGRGTAAIVTGIAAGYVALRLGNSGRWAPFEQDIGFGFSVIPARAAAERFGSFPVWIYTYNALATIGQVLFAEPTGGVFRSVRDVLRGDVAAWQLMYFASSLATTGIILSWGVRVVRRAIRDGWSRESRAAVALIVTLAACGVLSFNYSRDRLGGMAVVFYALAAFFAIRAALDWVGTDVRRRGAIALALIVLSAAWQIRALHTVEYSRQRAAKNRREWMTDPHERRTEFQGRSTYLRIMQELQDQGTRGSVQATSYPRWFLQLLGPF